MSEPNTPAPPPPGPPPGGGEPPAASPPPPPSGSPPPPPSGSPPPPAGGQSSNRGLMIVLSYLWILAIVPLVVEKDDKEVQWHAKHGLVLLVAEIILWVALWILGAVLAFLGDWLGCVTGILSLLLWVGVLIVHIIAIVKGVNGQRFRLPVVSDYADRF